MAVRALRRRDYFRDPLAGVVVTRMPRQPPIRQHRHEFLEIALILSGEGRHATGATRHPLGPGDVLILSSRRPHGYEETRGLNLVNILVREDVLPRLARGLAEEPGYHALFTMERLHWSSTGYHSRLTLAPDELALASTWVDRMEAELSAGGPVGRTLAEAWLVLLVGLLVRRHGGRTPRVPVMAAAGIGRVLSRMESRLAQPASVAAWAREAGMSGRTFLREFRRAVGIPPARYLLDRRIARARDFLASEPRRAIGEVAARCGFADSNHFSRAFRARTGMSPREWRRSRPGA